MRIPKWAKWTLGIIGGVILLLIGVSLYLSHNYKQLLQSKITEKVAEASKGLYILSIRDLDLNLLTGSVVIYDAKLSPDTTVYEKLLTAQEASSTYFAVELDRLTVQNFSLWQLLVSKRLDINRLSIDSIDLTVTKRQLAYTPTDTGSGNLYDKIKDSFGSARVGEVRVDNAHFAYREQQNTTYSTIRVDSIKLHVSDFLLDADSQADSTRIFYTKGIAVDIPGFNYSIPNSPYRLAFGHLHLDSKQKYAYLSKFKLEPRIRKQDFFVNDTQNKTLMALELDSIALENWNMRSMLDEGVLRAERMIVHNGATVFSKDKRYQEENVSKIGMAPHQQIMKMGQLIHIDTVQVQNVDIVYRQMHKSGDAEGVISFNNARGIITNLCNDTTTLRKNKFMRADLRAEIMGKGLLQAQFGFDMLSPRGAHTYKGSLGQMQAPAFNRIMTPLLNLEIADGNIKRILFNMKGDDYGNQGELKFDYSNFKINILGKPSEEGERKKKGILSFFVNEFFINESNPDSKGEYHVGSVQHVRVPEYSHFKTVWKSLLDGIVQCAGIDSKWLRSKI